MTTVPMTVTINGGSTSTGGRPVYGTTSFTQFIGFGDSNTDSGYFFTHNISNNTSKEALYQQAVAAGGGLPTDPGSPMNSTLLAQDFGLSAIPIGETGGTNYAASGATVTGALSGSLAPSIVNQINSYLTSVNGTADPNALYLISGGGNDSTIAQTMSVQNARTYMMTQADNLASAIGQLYNAGARYFLIDDNSGGGDLKAVFNDQLWSDLSNAGIGFMVDDTTNLIKSIYANPSAYGITNTTDPPEGPFTSTNPYNPSNGGSTIDPSPSTVPNGWARFATQDVSTGAANTYLWADDEHLSGVGQRIEAAYDYNVIQNAIPTISEVLRETQLTYDEPNGSITSANFRYQWQHVQDGQSNWTDIAGATSYMYTIAAADVGDDIRVETFFTGTNGDTATAVSPATFAVAACYRVGTRILTDHGEVAIEMLSAGDIVLTAHGAPRPIKWIGRRSYNGRFAAGNKDILPICIQEGALADNVPHRDLWVSPRHAMLLDGVLIEARDLVNDASIKQAVQIDLVEYLHIELDSHDVVLAEGAWSETFADDDSRGIFNNAAEYFELYQKKEVVLARYCAPRIDEGFELESIRVRLQQRMRSRSSIAS